ncbi:UNVERIFIED_CONTAM: helix-turn-helix transcriptional regulator [Methylobacteriaceae bacterium AG10]|nr:helix-turn-helix transcriptional regulator [Methylobacteriaceae bacterium AG10]
MSLDTFGQRVDHARKQKNLTQTKLAADMGISLKALRAYIQDTSKPQIHRLKKLAELLGVSESWLIDGKEIDPEAPLFSEAEMDEQIALAKLIYAKRHNVPVEEVRIGHWL